MRRPSVVPTTILSSQGHLRLFPRLICLFMRLCDCFACFVFPLLLFFSPQIDIGPERAKKLLDLLRADAAFLRVHGLMDYSLLVGIYYAPKGSSEPNPGLCLSSIWWALIGASRDTTTTQGPWEEA